MAFSHGIQTESAAMVVLRRWLMVSVGCLLMVTMDQVGWMNAVRFWIEHGLIQVDGYVIPTVNRLVSPWDFFRYGTVGLRRIADLEFRMSQLAVQQSEQQRRQSAVETERQILESSVLTGRAHRLVELLSVEGEVLVGAGTVDGVTEGQIVTDAHGVLVGRISRVSRYTAQIVVPTQDQSKIAAQTISASAKGVVVGSGTSALLTQVLQSEPLKVGEIVVTSGGDGVYPPGLVIGQIMALMDKPSDVTKGAIVSSLAEVKGWGAIW